MLGMLAGHAESGGDRVEREGKQYKLFCGMSSSMAMQKHAGGVAEDRASEGKAVEMPCKGPVDATMMEICGGVRSTCTYVGAGKLKELSKRTTFIRVTAQLNESLSNLRTDTSHGYTKFGQSSGGAGAAGHGAGAGATVGAPTSPAST